MATNKRPHPPGAEIGACNICGEPCAEGEDCPMDGCPGVGVVEPADLLTDDEIRPGDLVRVKGEPGSLLQYRRTDRSEIGM
jgi:hypothetical protein